MTPIGSQQRLRREPSAGTVSYSIRNQEGILAFCRTDAVDLEMRGTVFLDRDGVLNRRIVGGYVTRSEEFKVLRGVLPALRALRELQLQLVIVSNQAAVGKGLLRWEDLANITRMSLQAFQTAGGIVDAAFFCLHQPADACRCRKPRAGLLEEAARRLKIDFHTSFLIGDAPADILAGNSMGCRTIYLTRIMDPSIPAALQTRTLARAVQWIKMHSQF
jgi:D-glycero-D-manno-heptose 1,7-bisphosphate phosphatase